MSLHKCKFEVLTFHILINVYIEDFYEKFEDTQKIYKTYKVE